MSGSTGAVRGRPSTGGPLDIPEHDSGVGTAIHDWPHVSWLELGPLASAVGCGRDHVRQVLWEWNLSHLAEDAVMIVSELLTNALKASWVLETIEPVALRLLADQDRLVVEVWDHSHDDPQASSVASDSESGRGLMVVESLSSRWGSRRVSFSLKVVWSEIVFSR